MFGNRFSSSTSCSRWLHQTEPGRLDPAFSGRFLKVATHPDKLLETTLMGEAGCLITGDWNLLEMFSFHDIPISAPGGFLNLQTRQ